MRYINDSPSGIWGYLLEFFDSVGITIALIFGSVSEEFYSCIYKDGKMVGDFDGCSTRQQAQTEAIKKASEIFNNKG